MGLKVEEASKHSAAFRYQPIYVSSALCKSSNAVFFLSVVGFSLFVSFASIVGSKSV